MRLGGKLGLKDFVSYVRDIMLKIMGNIWGFYEWVSRLDSLFGKYIDFFWRIIWRGEIYKVRRLVRSL